MMNRRWMTLIALLCACAALFQSSPVKSAAAHSTAQPSRT